MAVPFSGGTVDRDPGVAEDALALKRQGEGERCLLGGFGHYTGLGGEEGREPLRQRPGQALGRIIWRGGGSEGGRRWPPPPPPPRGRPAGRPPPPPPRGPPPRRR